MWKTGQGEDCQVQQFLYKRVPKRLSVNGKKEDYHGHGGSLKLGRTRRAFLTRETTRDGSGGVGT